MHRAGIQDGGGDARDAQKARSRDRAQVRARRLRRVAAKPLLEGAIRRILVIEDARSVPAGCSVYLMAPRNPTLLDHGAAVAGFA